MGVRVAYGKRTGVKSAIQNGVIPEDSIIITKDSVDSELLFYDSDGNLMTIAERTRFETFTEAEQWAKDYPCVGFIFTVHNGAEWLPYIVQDDNSLAPFTSASVDVTNINRIDGGNSVGV